MKLVGKLATAVLIVGVGTAIYLSAVKQVEKHHIVQIKGVAGSEKLPFLRDTTTVTLLSDKPYQLHATIEKAGSREMATYNLSGYDFAFPAGVPAAEKIRQKYRVKTAIDVFYTPMVIASWKSVAKVLMANGIVHKGREGHDVVDMTQLLQLMVEKKRWNQLKGSDDYPANKSILVTTTDVRKSNSAAMFLSLASYVFNGQQIVQNRQQADAILPKLTSIFLRQGFTEHSSAIPFESYLTMGPGKTPLVMIYEAQFIEQLVKPNSPITDDMVLLYPEPTIYSKHVFIPFTPAGEKMGRALADDEALQKVAVRYGLRPHNIGLFRSFIQNKAVPIPKTLFNVIDPPSYEVLEYMIQSIAKAYQ